MNILCVYGAGPTMGTGHRVRMERLNVLLSPHTVILKARAGLGDLQAWVESCSPAVVVWDGRENPEDQVRWVADRGIATIVMDSNGEDRSWADVVVEGLPSLDTKPGSANLQGLPWLPPVELRRSEHPKGILAYGGGLNPGKETTVWIEALLAGVLVMEPPVGPETEELRIILAEVPGGETVSKWTRVGLGLGFQTVTFQSRAEVPDFHGLVGATARLVTYYGLTAFESLSHGIPLRLLSPRKIHGDLSEKHLPQWHVGVAGQALRGVSKAPGVAAPTAVLGSESGRFRKLVEILAAHVRPRQCPVCGGRPIRRRSRRPAGNLWHCGDCHVYFLEEVFPPSFWGEVLPPHAHGDYGEAYFTTEYVRAYGKTYAEDRPAITRMARGRLAVLRRLVPGGRLLDVGSALGFFLDAAAELGYETHGIERSAWAVQRTDPKHQVQAGSVLEIEPPGAFDAVTLWYVVEHFRENRELLTRLAGWVKPGGILAFSTPHGRGLSARFHTDTFLATSPDDHYFIYGTENLLKLLAPLGFELVHFEDTGIHKGRFEKAFPNLGRLLGDGFYRRLAKWAHWGDTGEWYFRKKASVTR